MALYTLAPFFAQQFFDQNGNPLNGGKIFTYLTATSTPQVTYSDSTGTTNANPIILDTAGRARIYLDPLIAYKIIITDSLGVQVGLTMDPVSLNQANAFSITFQGTTRGTVTAPAFTFVGDTDTGMWSSAANTLDFSTNGVQRLRLLPGGGAAMPDGSVSAPAYGFISDPNTGIFSPFADGIAFTLGGVKAVQFSGTPTGPAFGTLLNGNFGTGAVTGNQWQIGNNGSGGGAAGVINLNGKGSASNFIWADASAAPGVLRISTAAPEEDGTPSDTSGSVVGAQTSWHEFKSNIVPTTVTPDEALNIVTNTPVFDFEYPGGGFRDGDDKPIVFTGFVGYDRNDWFLTNAGKDQNPSLDEVTIPGYYALCFKALNDRIVALEAALKAK